MTVASLYNIPRDQKGMNQFSFANQDQHRQIIDRISALYGKNLTEYVIDPIDISDPGAFLYQHQQMHNDMDAVLGIAGNDFTDLDFRQVDQVTAWIQQHANEHYLAAAKLGIG